jgi:hypothetical protein
LHNFFEVKEREDGKGRGIPVVWTKCERQYGGERREGGRSMNGICKMKKGVKELLVYNVV